MTLHCHSVCSNLTGLLRIEAPVLSLPDPASHISVLIWLVNRPLVVTKSVTLCGKAVIQKESCFSSVAVLTDGRSGSRVLGNFQSVAMSARLIGWSWTLPLVTGVCSDAWGS